MFFEDFVKELIQEKSFITDFLKDSRQGKEFVRKLVCEILHLDFYREMQQEKELLRNLSMKYSMRKDLSSY